MNWGTKIFISFVLFAAFILFMVVRAFQENFDLVAEDYYAQEINYQQKLQQKANFEKLADKVEFTQDGGVIEIVFPASHQPEGKIHFYHPSRKLFDKRFDIDLDTENKQLVSRKDLVAGQYRVNITWQSDGKEYFQQERLFIQ